MRFDVSFLAIPHSVEGCCHPTVKLQHPPSPPSNAFFLFFNSTPGSATDQVPQLFVAVKWELQFNSLT